MTDEYDLGPAPANEEAVQVGDPDYRRKAMSQCRAYIQAIRAVCGREPEGARLRITSNAHDLGDYLSVAIRFDGNDRQAAEYAAKVDEHAPTSWAEAGMTWPQGHSVGR